MKIRWRNFKAQPPHDCAHDHEEGVTECDRDWGYFVYRYTNRPNLPNRFHENLFVSRYPEPFEDGVFEGYRSLMKTSPYPEDRIEVLAWIPAHEIQSFLLESFKKNRDNVRP